MCIIKYRGVSPIRLIREIRVRTKKTALCSCERILFLNTDNTDITDFHCLQQMSFHYIRNAYKGVSPIRLIRKIRVRTKKTALCSCEHIWFLNTDYTDITDFHCLQQMSFHYIRNAYKGVSPIRLIRKIRVRTKKHSFMFNKASVFSLDFAFVLESIGVPEVVEQPESEACCLQVVVHLRAVGVIKFCHRLEFHDDVTVAHEIGTVGSFQLLSIIVDLQFLLALEWDASLGELHSQGLLIHCFEEPDAQLVVHLHGCTVDGIRLLIVM